MFYWLSSFINTICSIVRMMVALFWQVNTLEEHVCKAHHFKPPTKEEIK